MTTALYGALLALLYLYLSVAVIRQRRRFQVAIGAGGHAQLERAIRVHANFAEYVPLALCLLFLVEFSGLPAVLVHILGAMLLLGRICHAYGVRQHPEPMKFRVLGMMLTFTMLLLSALAAIVIYLF